ncbi:MAG: SusC/RagA family TonB-linked outer membrane protein [Bacteroidales bacterium]|jgi:TonB-linked SusC/RagA family outer membrane protein|nr:SusC/RagA family TonB-linked outer membrane protein [Bacteroidales bacterium]
MRTKLLTLFTVLGLMLAQSIHAQPKTVTGSVTDASNNETLPGANVIIKNTTTGVSTDENGNYSIVVSPGQVLVFSSLGYATQEITVGSSNRINASLRPDVTMIEDVVVTSEFGMKRISKAVGSSVQNVKATDITESGRDNFITALQGRVAGMTVGTTSGAPGASTTVVLRSLTSISGNNQPLYIIDGVPMNNSTFNPINQVGSSSLEYYSVRNLDYASRGNDLNPEDIESMTVLKGAAAAALYGSDASNGAIIITTKKGVEGKGKLSYSNSFRWDDAYGYPEFQTKYANGYYGTTNYYYINKYGGLYPDGMQVYDNYASVLQTGFTQRHNLSAEGGTERLTLRASASLLDQAGVIKTSGYSRFNISLSGTAKINDWFSVESSMQYAATTNDKVPIGTEGPLYRTMLWPSVDDMSEYLAADGSHMTTPDYYLDGDLLNPLFGLYKNKFYDESKRFISNITANFTPIEKTYLKVIMGWDVGMQTYVTSRHPYYAAYNNGNGYYNMTKSNFSDPTLNVLAGYDNTFLDQALSLSVQVGYHQLENGLSNIATTGSKFAVPDFQSINNCDPLSISSTQRNTKRRIQALSAQVALGYQEMAYLTFRARNDWSSTLPVENNQYFYPAVEASFIVTELDFMQAVTPINYLKLRGSIAQVGKDAGPLEIDPQLEPTVLWGGGYRYGFTGPNKKLVPEMNTSKEIGFEGRFVKDRINTDFTYFWTNCEDQIVKGFRMSYGTGFVLNNMNVGEFKTWGWEGHIDGDVVRTASGIRWNIGVNASHTDSEVTYLPANLTEYYNAYTWNSGNIRNGIQVGYPVTSWTGQAFLRNANGDVLISPTTGLPVTSSAWSVIGNREPKLRFGMTTNVSYKGWRLSAMFAGRYGATVVNGTKRLMMQYGTSEESVKLRESGAVIFNGVLQDGNEETATPTPNNIVVDYGTFATTYTGGDENWLEKDVNYIRLQELRLAYVFPSKMLARTPFATATIFAAGNDLAVWTNYSGIDAVGNTVSAAAGGTGGEGMDVWSLPSPRGYSVGINVTFK